MRDADGAKPLSQGRPRGRDAIRGGACDGARAARVAYPARDSLRAHHPRRRARREHRIEDATTHETPPRALALRALVGGALMGLANLLPGISGGTLLLASGVYPAFVAALADLTRLRLRPRALLLLLCVALGAGAAILLLAGVMRALLLEHRAPLFSLFIGLTLGGAPLLWRRVPRPRPVLFVAAALALVAMLGLLLVTPGAAADASGVRPSANPAPLLFLAGLAGACAMLLPGVSGATLLLLLGQYLPILYGLEQFGRALGGAGEDTLRGALQLLAPAALGAGLGLLALSNLLRHALARWPQAAHGALLGLLAGAIVPLWPFRSDAGVYEGASLAGLAGALVLASLGFALTRGLDHLAQRLGARD